MSSVRPVNIAQLRAEFERRPDGSLLVTNPEPLGPYPGRMGAHFEHWSRAAPDRTMIAERDTVALWRSLSYAEAMQQVRAIAQGLLARDLSAGRPVMILSDNSIAHLLVALACLHVGVPYSPVSPAYSLLATDFAKLRQCAGLLTPGLVFAAEGARFAAAIEAVIPADAEVVITGDAVHKPEHNSTQRVACHGARPRRLTRRRSGWGRITSRKYYSPPARPGCQRASSTPTACCAAISR